MVDQRRLHCGNGKARADSEKAKREHKAYGTAAQERRSDSGDDSQGRCHPPDWLALCREIKNDAGAEGDREPWQQPTGANFDERPFADTCWDGELGLRPSRAPDLARSADRPSPYASPDACSRATWRAALVRHRAPPKLRAPNTAAMLPKREHNGEWGLAAGGDFGPAVAQADGAIQHRLGRRQPAVHLHHLQHQSQL